MIEGLLVEDYRPSTIEECILPESIKHQFQELVKLGEIPNLILHGTGGVGKTTVARALCNELKCEYLLLNGSEENGIDVLRTKVRDFASTGSLDLDSTVHKVIIFDEGDYLNQNSTQPALRGMIEEFHSNCRFIFTCNHPNRIIAPLHSRCSVIEFKVPKAEQPKILMQFMKRCMEILDKNDIPYEKPILAQVIKNFAPDFRRVLNELQRYAASGKIDAGILSTAVGAELDKLIQLLKDKNWKEMRQWVVESSADPIQVYSALWSKMYDHIAPASCPTAVLIIRDTLNNLKDCVNPEIEFAAGLTELMSEVEFK